MMHSLLLSSQQPCVVGESENSELSLAQGHPGSSTAEQECLSATTGPLVASSFCV